MVQCKRKSDGAGSAIKEGAVHCPSGMRLSRCLDAVTVGAMVWGVKRKHRGIAAALALLGVAFYALLLPWHLTSQFQIQLHRTDVGQFAGAMCSSDGSSPAMPATGCPICKGLAAFQPALAPPGIAALPVMPHATPVHAALRDDAVGAAVPAHRSRGPPVLPA